MAKVLSFAGKYGAQAEEMLRLRLSIQSHIADLSRMLAELKVLEAKLERLKRRQQMRLIRNEDDGRAEQNSCQPSGARG